jgi:phthalate 3,4-cis-dihydrodiol dehydrogenase
MAGLSGKVALLVGAGSGIGRAVLDAFLEEGARVVALEIDPLRCQQLSELGNDVVAVQGDATTLEANQGAVSTALDRFGRLDTLATFVGVFDYYTRLVDLPEQIIPEAFDEIFRTNVLSYVLSVRAAHDALHEHRGSIVLTLSSSSFYPGRGGVLYVATKSKLYAIGGK